MKKKLMILSAVLLLGFLVACGDSNNNNNNDNANEPDTEENNNVAENDDVNENDEDDLLSEGGEVVEGETGNENFDRVIEILEDNGFEIDEVTIGDAFNIEFFDAEDALGVEINGNDEYPLFVMEMDPDHENLEGAAEAGEIMTYYDGEEVPTPATIIDNYVFFLAALHDDQPEILEAMENEF